MIRTYNKLFFLLVLILLPGNYWCSLSSWLTRVHVRILRSWLDRQISPSKLCAANDSGSEVWDVSLSWHPITSHTKASRVVKRHTAPQLKLVCFALLRQWPYLNFPHGLFMVREICPPLYEPSGTRPKSFVQTWIKRVSDSFRFDTYLCEHWLLLIRNTL